MYTFELDTNGNERLPGHDLDPLAGGCSSRDIEASGTYDSEFAIGWSRCCASYASAGTLRPPQAAGLKDPMATMGSKLGSIEFADKAPSDSSVELLVDISKMHPGDDLGVKVLHRGVGVLVVADIYAGGAAEASSRRSALVGAECLQVGDQIATVNGIGGDDVAMAEECRRARRLTLGIRRVQAASTRECSSGDRGL